MEVRVFAPAELHIALAAVRAIPSSPTPAGDDLLRAIALLHGCAIEPPALERPTLARVARHIADPHRRKRLVELAIVMAMVDGDVSASARRASPSSPRRSASITATPT